MLIKINYPPGWFRDFDSLQICHRFSLPAILANEWIDSSTLPLEAHLIIPALSELSLSAEKNRLHVLEFVTYDTHFIHPKKLAKWFNRNLSKKIRGVLRK